MKSREHVFNDHVIKLTKIWLLENETKFENFVLVFYCRENVWITCSEISHESTHHREKNIQKTIFF
jgi:hypothetical protein